MEAARLLGEAELLAVADRRGRNHEGAGLRARDGFDRALAKLGAENALARGRIRGAAGEVLVRQLGPTRDLSRRAHLDDRALVDPAREAVERGRARTGPLGRTGRLVHQHLEGLDLVLEARLAGLVTCRGADRRAALVLDRARVARTPTTLRRASTEERRPRASTTAPSYIRCHSQNLQKCTKLPVSRGRGLHRYVSDGS